MKRLLLLSSLLLMVLAATAGVEKLDGYSRWQMSVASPGRSMAPIRAFVKSSPSFDADSCGLVEVRRFGDWLLVEGTAEALAEAAESPAVQHISFGRELRLTNDRSAATIGADVVHTGRGLDDGIGYTGRGVAVGLYDIGFDFCNPAYCDESGESRIRSVFLFDAEGNVDVHNTPAGIAALVTDDADDCHGSHVLGTMAGSGGQFGRRAILTDVGSVTIEEGPVPFGGIAPDADIYISAGALTDANIVAGVAEIVDAAQGAPCVVNLSLSDALGPHDGSDAFASAISSMTDDAVIVVSSGNDTGLGRSLSATFSPETPWLGTFLRPVTWKPDAGGAAAVWSGLGGDVELYVVIVDTGSKTELARYKAPTEADGAPLVLTSKDFVAGSGRPDAAPDEFFDRAYTDSWLAVVPERSPSGRLGWYIPFYLHIRPENERAYIAVGLVAEGKDGRTVDMHLSAPYANFMWLWVNGYSNGGDDLSVSSLGAADGVVCVGANTGLIDYGRLDGTVGHVWEAEKFTMDDVAHFSSYGTLRDGRSLPHVVAPGAQVVSVYSTPYAVAHDDYDIVAESSDGGRTSYWTPMYGTSMSAPAVAGAVALWLESDPSLSSADVHDIIAKTSAIPAGSQYGSERWGAGLLNAYAGVQEVLRRRAALAGPSAVESPGLVVAADGHLLSIQLPGKEEFCGVIYDTSGRIVNRFSTATGTATAIVASPGIYIITSAGHTAKVVVR